MPDPRVRAVVGYVGGLLFFLAFAYSLKYGLEALGNRSAAVSQLVGKTTLALLSLAAWRLLGRPFGEMGWRSPSWNRSLLPWFVVGAVAMMAGTVVMIFLEVRHPIAAQLSFWQIVLVIWLLSSFSEEVYVRGLVQSWVVDREDGVGLRSAFAPSVVSSALLFGSMHVPLMFTPAGVKGGLTLVLATLGLGWACAVLRARTRSLWPAIACHILGNVAAVPAGVLGVILYRLTYGHLPEFLTPH